ncbi:MAG: hypothetical protein HOG45_05845 [Deltaproteobacteria bacterium]|nr:hypothetical protein [Deltaproteobacteria bacterium]
MKFFFNIHVLVFTLLVFVLVVSCADVETETSGYAALEISLDDVSYRKAAHSKLAPNFTHGSEHSMTSSDAVTILAVLMPAVKCESSSANSGSEYSRALVDITTQNVKLLIPLDTQVKLCLYFYRETLSLNELGKGTSAPEGFGESGIFSIDSETIAKTVSVEFWNTSYSTVTLKISSISSIGFFTGSKGTAKLNSGSGVLTDNKSFTITSADNGSKSVEFTNVVYDSYSYDIEIMGFIPADQAFLVSSETETLDVKLTPNYVDIDWLSFDNMSISQVGTSPYATASGTLVLNVPYDLKDNVTQIISLMQVKRITGNTIVDVTPPVDLSIWTKTAESTDNVTYTTEFLTASYLPLIHGSNELQVVLTVNDESKILTMGNIGYDACIDADTMCLSLSWTDGLDPDLHSYYFPDWAYNEETTNSSFDNSSRGPRYWVYSNVANKKYSVTGDTIQPIDGNSSSDNETQVWATHGQKVGNGTYLFYVEDVSEKDVQNFKLVLSGPGLSDNLTYGPYNFKDDDNDSTTEALNPQAVFFIQVDNNSIVRSDNVSVGDNLSSDLMQWTGELQNSVVD